MKLRLPERLQLLEQDIAKAAGVQVEELRKEMRDRSLVNARAMVWFVAHEEMGYPATALARFYHRDHTTILHHVKRLRGTDEAARIVTWLKERAPGLFDKSTKNPGFLDDWELE
jgi:chromosomal replication initiation ATPase DnaA